VPAHSPRGLSRTPRVRVGDEGVPGPRGPGRPPRRGNRREARSSDRTATNARRRRRCRRRPTAAARREYGPGPIVYDSQQGQRVQRRRTPGSASSASGSVSMASRSAPARQGLRARAVPVPQLPTPRVSHRLLRTPPHRPVRPQGCRLTSAVPRNRPPARAPMGEGHAIAAQIRATQSRSGTDSVKALGRYLVAGGARYAAASPEVGQMRDLIASRGVQQQASDHRPSEDSAPVSPSRQAASAINDLVTGGGMFR